MAAAGSKNWKNPRVILGAVLIVAVLFLVASFTGNVIKYMRVIRSGETDPFAKDRFDRTISALMRQTPLDESTFNRMMSDPVAPRLGNKDAKIRIVEFLDYQCPFSKKTSPAIRAFMSKHMDDAFLIVRDYPITSVHDRATDAAIAAQCVLTQGGSDKYWSYNDLLFQNQDNLTAENLRGYALSVGVDPSAFDVCMSSRDLETDINKDTAAALSVNVNGTPTFFMNGYRIPGAATLEQFEAIYEEIKKRI